MFECRMVHASTFLRPPTKEYQHHTADVHQSKADRSVDRTGSTAGKAARDMVVKQPAGQAPTPSVHPTPGAPMPFCLQRTDPKPLSFVYISVQCCQEVSCQGLCLRVRKVNKPLPITSRTTYSSQYLDLPVARDGAGCPSKHKIQQGSTQHGHAETCALPLNARLVGTFTQVSECGRVGGGGYSLNGTNKRSARRAPRALDTAAVYYCTEHNTPHAVVLPLLSSHRRTAEW